MTVAQAATRLRVDSSRVIAYINHGLTQANYSHRRIYLAAIRLTNRQWSITAEAVRAFKAERKRLGY